MSEPSASPSPPAPSASPGPVDPHVLVQTIRRDLIQAQITILELQDSLLQKETEKADAIAILGESEHFLEEKINYIVELDRVLNERIAALEARHRSDSATHAEVVGDLVQKIDTANRELGAAHTLAAGFARDLAHTRDELQRTARLLEDRLAELTRSNAALAQTQGELAHTGSELATTRSHLQATQADCAAKQRKIDTMQASMSWKLTAPLRALRRLLA